MSISWDERGETPVSAGTPAGAGAVRGAWLTPRRVMLIFAAAVALVAIAIAARLTHTLATKKTVTNRVTPAVTVTEAGRSAAPTTVSITGTIGARYDTPIGAEGDAGRVSAVYVEAGDHVKRGQVLARIDTSVLLPQVANLQAALDLAQAESELAAAEYQRAVAVGKSGALSTEETERRRSSSVTAAAKVKVAAAQLAEAQARPPTASFSPARSKWGRP
jgi:HlyD family secretion protein